MELPDHADAVLTVVEEIPPGRVMSYGAVADVVCGRGGVATPRTVGTVMARYGAAVCGYRVVIAVGRLPPGHEMRARGLLSAEGVPFRGERVDMRAAAWYPADAGEV